jgi:hypothetical protein
MDSYSLAIEVMRNAVSDDVAFRHGLAAFLQLIDDRGEKQANHSFSSDTLRARCAVAEARAVGPLLCNIASRTCGFETE